MNDRHFNHVLEQYDAVDLKIMRDEEKIEPINDDTLHELKLQRLKLKDELYQMAIQAWEKNDAECVIFLGNFKLV